MKSALVLPIFATLLSVVKIGAALKCYECNQADAQNCNSPLNTDKISATDCRHSSYIIGNHDGMEYQCVAYLDRYLRDNRTFITRQCLPKTNFDFCKKHEEHGYYEHYAVDSCYTCHKDECNGAEKLSTVFLYVISLITILKKLLPA